MTPVPFLFPRTCLVLEPARRPKLAELLPLAASQLPLLFDRNRQPMAAFHAVCELLANPRAKPLREVTSHAPWPRNDANSREAHKQLLAKTKQGKIDVYFQGDSITRRWGATDYAKLLAHWKETFHGWNAANFAWGGDNTHHIQPPETGDQE